MSTQSRWVGKESAEAIADVRLRCYGYTPADRARFVEKTPLDRFGDGDVLLLEDGDTTVGTATSLSLKIGVRGGVVPCQGVAWVGTVRSHRRRKIDGLGVATTVMKAIVAKARERGEVASALMPFRSSFYEHFGYGTVERQNVWTVPLSILPTSDSLRFHEAAPADFPAMAGCRSRQVAAGQCDVDGGDGSIEGWMRYWEPLGFTFVDQPVAGGPITGFVNVHEVIEGDRAIADVEEPAHDSPDALIRILSFLGTLKDQYSFARLRLPVDLPLNWLLKERQVSHRRIDHAAAQYFGINRMQLRVLDHAKFIEAMHLPPGPGGKVVISVQESEGHESRFAIDFSAGRASVSPSQASPQVVVKDYVWSAVVTGMVPATQAHRFGLLSATSDPALLDRFSTGPAGFSWDYF